jgi:endonuclease G
MSRRQKVKLATMMLLIGTIAFGETNELWGDISGNLTTQTDISQSNLIWADWNSVTGYLHSATNIAIGDDIVHWQTMTNWVGVRGDWDRGTAYAGQPVSSNVSVILTNDAYLVGYSEEDRCPLWVCYTLHSTKEAAPTRPSTSFKTDKRTMVQVKDSDYTNTGYDRGHMAPSYGIGLCFGTNAQLQTFLMSNVIPQTPELNRGIWKKMEQTAANDWAQERDKIWVITGPVFIETNRVNGIRVPAGSFKIFVDETDEIEVQAFLMPQNPLEDATFGLYLTSVDEIERQTGLDFFTELPDDIEDEVERGTW